MPDSDGYAELKAKLATLAGDARVQIERKALAKVGKLIKEAIVERAPERTDDTKSGSALAPGAIKADIRSRVAIGYDDEVSTVTIGPSSKTAHVARWVEKGHANKRGKNRRSQTSHGSTPAHPFIRPAVDATQDEAIATFQAEMAEGVKKAMQ